MVAAANDTQAATPPIGDNPAQGGVNGGGYGGTRGGHKNINNMAAKGDARSKFTGNMTEMKGYVFQPCHVSKNANQYHETMEVLYQYVAKEYETGRELMALFLPTPTQAAVLKLPFSYTYQITPCYALLNTQMDYTYWSLVLTQLLSFKFTVTHVCPPSQTTVQSSPAENWRELTVQDNSIVPSTARHSENLRPSWTKDPSSTVLLPKQT